MNWRQKENTMSDLFLGFTILLAALCGFASGFIFAAICFATEYRAIKDQLLESQIATSRAVTERNAALSLLEAQLAEPDYMEQPK